MTRHLPLLSLLALFALAAGIYSTGLSGGFVFDDNPNIVLKELLRVDDLTADALWSAAWSGTSGPLRRPVAMVSFALNYYAFGLDPYYFKLVNLGIHLLVGLLLGVLGYLLLGSLKDCSLSETQRRWVAALTAGAWLLHPINLTAVLYIVQRMTSLATLFSVLGCLFYVLGRRRLIRADGGWPRVVSAFVLCLPLSVLSKESGILFLAYVLVIEICVFRFQTARPLDRILLRALFLVVVLLPAVLALGYLLLHSERLLGGYAFRDFDLTERLMTQARVVVWYLKTLLAPSVGELGLYHDDIPISRGLLTPWTTLPSIALLSLLLTVAVSQMRTRPMVSFGILFFFAGHLLESTIWPLDMAFEHRNYLAGFGILFAGSYVVVSTLAVARVRKALAAVAAVWLVLLSTVLTLRADQWSDDLRHTMMEAENHPDSVRARYGLGRQYAILAKHAEEERDILYEKAEREIRRAAALSSQSAQQWVAVIIMYAERGEPLPEDVLPNLLSTLGQRPLSVTAAGAYGSLVRCELKGMCNLDPQTMMEIGATALSSNASPSRYKGAILSEMSAYFGRKLKDTESAIHYSRLAIAEDPGRLIHHFGLIEWYFDSGRCGGIGVAIDELERSDSLRMFGRQVEDFRVAHRRQCPASGETVSAPG